MIYTVRQLRTFLLLLSVAVGANSILLAAAPSQETEDKTAEIVLASGEQAPKDHISPQVYLDVDRLPAGQKARVAVVIDVENGWHINTNPARPEFVVPTSVSLKAKHGTKLASIAYPKGKELTIEGFDQPVSVYEGRVMLFGTLEVPKEAPSPTEELTIEIKFQACNDRQCLAPKSAKLTGKIPVAAPGESVKKVNEKIFEKDERREKQAT